MRNYLYASILVVGGLLGTGCNSSSTTPSNTPDSGTTPDAAVDAGSSCTTATNPLNKCSNSTCVPFDNMQRLPLLYSDGGVPPLP